MSMPIVIHAKYLFRTTLMIQWGSIMFWVWFNLYASEKLDDARSTIYELFVKSWVDKLFCGVFVSLIEVYVDDAVSRMICEWS